MAALCFDTTSNEELVSVDMLTRMWRWQWLNQTLKEVVNPIADYVLESNPSQSVQRMNCPRNTRYYVLKLRNTSEQLGWSHRDQRTSQIQNSRLCRPPFHSTVLGAGQLPKSTYVGNGCKGVALGQKSCVFELFWGWWVPWDKLIWF